MKKILLSWLKYHTTYTYRAEELDTSINRLSEGGSASVLSHAAAGVMWSRSGLEAADPSPHTQER